MNSTIITKTYEEPPFCEKEILKYAGCKSFGNKLLQLLRACIEEVRGKLTYKVCYCELPVVISDEACDFQCMKVRSESLAKNLQGCQTVVIFAATIGVEIDRLIAKYGRISPTKALLFQAIGAERIEALCDVFCSELAGEPQMSLKPRFSPGYGDLPLQTQEDIFLILDCAKRIGLSLNDSLLMSPSKSVTAFVGLIKSENITDSTNNVQTVGIQDTTDIIQNRIKCTACEKTDCEYRGV